MQFFAKTNINFVGYRKQFFLFSLVLTFLGLLAVVIWKPVFSIDFEGGTEIAVKFAGEVQTDEIRKTVEVAGFSSEIKSFGDANQYLIRVKDSENAPEQIMEALKTTFASASPELLKVDRIGPKIGQEMRSQATLAIAFSVAFILMYIAFRFDFVFGLGAIVALIHDVFITFSVIVITHHLGILNLELGQSILAAMLTVVGYSINDTVIVFDRIRENRELHKSMDIPLLINKSINDMLSRTFNTTFTTVIVLFTIMVFGGPVLQGFAFTMMLGIVFGTYSSMYIASSFVIWYLQNVKKVDISQGFKEVAKA